MRQYDVGVVPACSEWPLTIILLARVFDTVPESTFALLRKERQLVRVRHNLATHPSNRNYVRP